MTRFRDAIRVAVCGWPERDMDGYDVLTVSFNYGRFGWRHILRPYWALRRAVYVWRHT